MSGLSWRQEDKWQRCKIFCEVVYYISKDCILYLLHIGWVHEWIIVEAGGQMAWEEGEPQSGTKILLQSSHFSICLNKPHLYLSSLPTFLFVWPNYICICLLIPLFYLSDQTTFVFVSAEYICNFLLFRISFGDFFCIVSLYFFVFFVSIAFP